MNLSLAANQSELTGGALDYCYSFSRVNTISSGDQRSMFDFRRLKIKHKINVVVILTSFLGLMIASAAMIAYDQVKQREILAEELAILAKVVAMRSTAAITFSDAESARGNLSTLKARDSVQLACMYDAEQRVFVGVSRNVGVSPECPVSPKADGHFFGEDYLDVYQTVELNGKAIGNVMVRSGLDELEARLVRQLFTSVGILVISLAAAFLLTTRLQKQVYGPIVQLGSVATRITQDNNYSIRAKTDNEDELGNTVKAFNSMLNKIEEDKEELTRLAFYDPLTGLPNRRMFKDRLEMAIENARRGSDRMALIFLDLDKFKQINDTMGHDIGDLLLKAVAKRLEAAMPETGTAFRLSGDEFTVIQNGVVRREDMQSTADRILEELAVPLVLAGKQITISASLGIAISEGNDNIMTLMKAADTALYQAKDAGRSNYKFSGDREQDPPTEGLPQ